MFSFRFIVTNSYFNCCSVVKKFLILIHIIEYLYYDHMCPFYANLVVLRNVIHMFLRNINRSTSGSFYVNVAPVLSDQCDSSETHSVL